MQYIFNIMGNSTQTTQKKSDVQISTFYVTVQFSRIYSTNHFPSCCLPGEESTGELQLMGLSPTPPYPMATTKRIDACNAPIQCHVSLGVPLRLRLSPVQGHDQHPGGRRGENCDSVALCLDGQGMEEDAGGWDGTVTAAELDSAYMT